MVIFYWTTVTAFVTLTILLLGLEWKKEQLYLRSIDPVEQKFNTILDTLGVIISNQEHLDADVAALTAAAAAISSEIAALKAQPSAESLDFTGLDNVVETLQGLVPAPAAPADEVPAAPAAPADEAAPADGTQV